ncbi:hypothetical protein BANRA_05044 [Klebsiella pneumoniae]|nr:hypothetical protein BANRA_05044 [Klebsiella pneumoniae]
MVRNKATSDSGKEGSILKCVTDFTNASNATDAIKNNVLSLGTGGTGAVVT